MTHMTYTPGYQGYLRNYQRNFVSGGGREQPASKYGDFELETHGLMADSRSRSNYSRATDGGLFLAHQNAYGGNTRLVPSHKDSRQAARIAAHTRPAEQRDAWNWQQGASGASESAAAAASGAPSDAALARLALVPPAGRSRQPVALYGTSYGAGVGVGMRPASAPVHPQFPHAPVHFPSEGAMLPALDSTLNKSLAQAIASLPAADNILKGNVDLHGSYSRDLGHRGHHPLQRTAGLVGGPPTLHAGSITSGSAAGSYAQAPATHHHNFPSASLIGPSGHRVGPHPIEGTNEYPHTSYAPPPNNSSAPSGALWGSQTTRARLGMSVSEMATTRELFAGSTKSGGGLRIPGYAGFIPASAANQLSLTGALPGASPAKAHILDTYSHDMPGYSGHQPRSVVNDRGPRSPRGKKRLNEGLVASLILDSMKI